MSEIGVNALGSFIGNEASAIIRIAVKRIAEEISLARHLTRKDGALKKLSEELNQLASLVPVDSEKSITNKVLLSWLTKVENIAYDAQDLLDAWCYAKLKRHAKVRRNRTMRVFYDVSYLFIRQKAAHDVNELLEKIQSIYDDATRRGISAVQVAGGELPECSSSSSRRQQQGLIDRRRYVEPDSLCGREDDFAEILKLLKQASNSPEKLNVVGIVGMGGVGKTTLSIQVFKSEEVKKLFDPNLVIFVVVSHEDGSTNAIMKKIAKEVFKKDVESGERTSKLQEELGENKYLLILDDVWNTICWNTLSSALLEIGGSEGTTILVTSRETQVVQNMSTHGAPGIWRLKGLSEAHSWDLFTKRISGDNLDRKKREIAERMIKKCEGNPLAIILLGDLLRKNNNLEKWREFEKSKEWVTHDKSGILPSLKLSFIHLETQTLKSCFSYCAIFGEDERIKKDQLIQLWMAQGLLPKRAHAEMEVVGEECFNDLLNSSLFHEPWFDDFGEVESVKMHDLVRDLACHISERNNEGEASGSGSGVRHLSVSAIEDALHDTDWRMLRTCLIKKNILNLNILKDFKKLRALSFEINSDSKIKKKDWESLGNLKHLRFLYISIWEKEETLLCLLPQIAKLYHLQTLSLDFFPCPPNFVLPEDFSNLVNLRHLMLCSGSIGIIAGLGHLTNLQTLPQIDLNKDCGGRISELQNLNKLRGILVIDNIDQIQNVKEARSINLGDKSSLQALFLRHIRNADEILEALRPPDSLIDLTIADFTGTRFPTWLTSSTGFLSNLVGLALDGCEWGTGELNMENFKSLRSLILTNCYELTVAFPVDGFQCCKLLENLLIRDCYKVQSLPNLSPLTNLRGLSILNIGIRPKATSKLQGLDYLHCSYLGTNGFLLPETLSHDSSICKSLKRLYLTAYYDDDGGHGDDAETIPLQLQHFVALQHLWVEGYRGLKALPDWLGNMTSLQDLHLLNMPELEHLPSTSTWDRLSNLHRISIEGCPLLRRYVPSTGVHEKWTEKILFF